MSYVNDTQMSEIRFSDHVSTLRLDDDLKYDAFVSIAVNEPKYIPRYSNISKFIRSYKGTSCRPDCLVSELFDWVVDQVGGCSHVSVTCTIHTDDGFKGTFVRELDFKRKKVM